MSIPKFTLYYFAYAIVLAGIAFALPQVFPDVTLLVNKFWLIFCFLGGITYIAYVTAYFGIKMNAEAGVMAIMGSIVLKMIFSLAFVLIYSINSKEKGVVFALNFFSLYLLFSFFEIFALLRNLRLQNNQ
ncbi:hypothetical protein LPB86_01090 [Pedobacter sp. MC2016-14]|uniref:hypothetical protein n=1 Tax=Pedobacter sp. MC2016-14 TaxID=2897327 RepID=UPI001E4B77E5|nr:hypothetical protein [Pedobacter sp. MC2016-14]MCD0486802.1 hypothetical protein [Pedobacter sp. MC2016-14]